MKGIILAGGSGTRLYPLTHCISKQLLPVYDKPMIYYPLSVLMLAGIREVLVIATREDMPRFQQLLGTGEQLGIQIEYACQDEPRGLADALIIGESFIGKDPVTLILGDNIFFGQHFTSILQEAVRSNRGATIFGYAVRNPERFGVVEFDEHFNVRSIEEKPENPKSNFAITGLYIYDQRAVEFAKNLVPSERGELEITDLNNLYLANHDLRVKLLGRGFAWFDAGTHHSLLAAAQFIETIEQRQGLKIACLEEIAYNLGYIDKKRLLRLAEGLRNNEYGEYLMRVAHQDDSVWLNSSYSQKDTPKSI